MTQIVDRDVIHNEILPKHISGSTKHFWKKNTWLLLTFVEVYIFYLNIGYFYLSSLDWYVCWETSCLRGYHAPNSQCFDTDMIY